MQNRAAIVILWAIGALATSAAGAERQRTPTVPILFEPNQGQVAEAARFVARAPGYSVRLETAAAIFDFGAAEARLTFRGARPSSVQGESPSPAVRNYYQGNDPAAWLAGVPTFGRVRYRELLPGIDLVFHAGQDLEFDLVLAPGADPDAIELLYDGFRAVEIESGGDLRLETAGGVLRQHSPDVFQDGRRIAARYVRRGARAIGIELGSYDHARAVLIDPRISYASFLGGGINEALGALATDAEGNYYIAGISDSPDYPRMPAGQPAAGLYDLAISKFDNNNRLVYSTVLGGSANENVFTAVVGSDGNLYLAAATGSTNFPQPAGSTLGGGAIGTGVVRLNAAGQLNATAFLPAPITGAGYGLALDPNGNVWITGGTVGIPGQVGSIQANPAGGQDVFVARFNAALTQVTYFTYLGTAADESGTRIAVDSGGNIFVSGNGGSAAFPTGPSPAFPAAGSFVLKLDPAANRILFATYLSGGGGGAGLLLDGDNVWVCANSTGVGFTPTADALQSGFGGGLTDAALLRLNASNGQIGYATYYGGGSNEFTNNMIQDPFGNLVVIGTTQGTGLTVSDDALQPAFGGGPGDGFLLVVDAAGRRVYASYLGGSGGESGATVAADPAGNVIAVGTTTSRNFPVTAGAFQSEYVGAQPDHFIARIELVAPTDPSLVRVAIQNAASFRGGPVAPGEIVTIYPRNAGPPELVTAALTQERRIATVLAGTRVLFDDVPAPLVYAVRGQISAVVPYEVAGKQIAYIVVEQDGVKSRPMPVAVSSAAPGIFTVSGGVGPAVVLNQDTTLNSQGNAAARDSIVVFFATGEGQTNPAGVNGRLNEFARLEDFPRPVQPVTVTIGGQQAEIIYAGGAPLYLAGLMQFNVRVPQGVTPGSAVELLITVGGIASAPGVTLAVQ